MFFWNKNKIEFKRGEIVKVKDGTKYPKLEVDIGNWYGRVFEINKKTIEVELDSITLKNLDIRIFDYFQEIGEYPHLITIPKKDLELVESRDKYEEVEKVQDEISEKIDSNNKKELQHLKLTRKWTRHFLRSKYYSSLDKIVREDSDSIIELFTNQMFDYEGKTPKKWNKRSAKEVFLNWAPNKITADSIFFESYGIVLTNYFKFLEERKYLKTKALQELLEKVKDEIVIKSQDSSNWGMAKSFMMGAKKSGVDLDDKRAMDEYLMKEQIKRIDEIEKDELIDPPVEESLKRKFRGIWRNQKITVKYENGEIKENIRFKEVENDLLRGICELIKK